MSDLTTLTASLIAKQKQDYLAEFIAWTNKVRDDLISFSSALLTAVTATSTSTLTIQTGQQTANIGAGKKFAIGMQINVANSSANRMLATVDSYTDNATGPLVFTVATAGDLTGSGSFASWTISLTGPKGTTGPPGAQGAAGADGNLSAGANLSMYSNFGVWGP